MLDRLKTKLRVTQIKQGLAGNASALNAALSMLDRVGSERAEADFSNRHKKAAPAKKLGKKEQRQLTAQQVSGKFAPPAGPKLIVDNRS